MWRSSYVIYGVGSVTNARRTIDLYKNAILNKIELSTALIKYSKYICLLNNAL